MTKKEIVIGHTLLKKDGSIEIYEDCQKMLPKRKKETN